MVPSEALKMLARLYLDHTGITPHALGERVGLGGKFFKLVMAGKGFHSAGGDAAWIWFSENWPDDLAWPRSITRLAATDSMVPTNFTDKSTIQCPST
jgi:hypothetical protein